MKKLRQKITKTALDDINISPLIDIIFILLIFFMVTSVFKKDSGVNVNRPKALSALELPTEILSISIDSDKKVLHDGLEIGLSGVRLLVKNKLRTKERPVMVLVDKSIEIDFYTKVHDEIALAGAKSISMATEN